MVHDENPVVEFNATDRCDGCGAQAHALARSDKGELLFCVHHLKKCKDNLLDEGWEVVEDWKSIEALYKKDNTYSAPV